MHARLAVLAIVFEPFHLVLEHEREVILELDQVLTVVLFTALTTGSVEHGLFHLYLLPLSSGST